tara:strand:+ start:88190 stop:88513 length:324 start_codon:yes stop_codon:yes gene_type:complete
MKEYGPKHHLNKYQHITRYPAFAGFSLSKINVNTLDAPSQSCILDTSNNETGIQNMTYYESAEDITITQIRAQKEVEKHVCRWLEFILEMGDYAEYNAQSVLQWLGY